MRYKLNEVESKRNTKFRKSKKNCVGMNMVKKQRKKKTEGEEEGRRGPMKRRKALCRFCREK